MTRFPGYRLAVIYQGPHKTTHRAFADACSMGQAPICIEKQGLSCSSKLAVNVGDSSGNCKNVLPRLTNHVVRVLDSVRTA